MRKLYLINVTDLLLQTHQCLVEADSAAQAIDRLYSHGLGAGTIVLTVEADEVLLKSDTDEGPGRAVMDGMKL